VLFLRAGTKQAYIYALRNSGVNSRG